MYIISSLHVIKYIKYFVKYVFIILYNFSQAYKSLAASAIKTIKFLAILLIVE